MTATDDLTTRMFAAARTIDEFRAEWRARHGIDGPWTEDIAPLMRTWADRWDREAAERAAEDAAVEELARELHLARIVSGQVSGQFEFEELCSADQLRRRTEARQLIKSGYRKGGA